MRILILNWWDPKNPKAGGAEVYLKETFSRLVKKEHNIILLCSRFASSFKKEKVDGIQIIRISPSWLINIASFFWYLKNKKRFDLVIDFTNKIPYLTPLFVRSKPSIAVVLHLFGCSLQSEYGFLGRLLAFWERCLFRIYKNTHFITISKSTRDELVQIEINSSKIKVIYPGQSFVNVDSDFEKSKTPLLIYVGRLKKYKRLDFLLDALQEVIRKIPDLKTVILGEGPDKKRLLKIRQKHNLENQVMFLGYVSDQEKIQWFNEAWINVQPSMKEGWGLTVIEAAACGVPTIAANVPGLRESVINGKTGWLFNNSEQLKNCLVEVLTNTTKREKAGQEARKFAQQFSWDKTAEEVEEEIQRWLRRKF